MYLLDTNVISEMRRLRSGKIDRNVRAWASGVDFATLYLSAITVQELNMGILLVEPHDPAQATVLRSWLEDRILTDFAGRILPVDVLVARQSAQLHVMQTRPYRDALIAATAYVHNMPVITRNVKDFVDTGVEVINPWQL